MYSVTVRREFVAQHFLTVPDPGPEGDLHSHAFRAEVRVEGEGLDQYDYLVDIDDAKAALDGLADRYRDATLNDLAEFEGHNPSVERFARVFADRFVDRIDAPGLDAVEVTLWEDGTAAASYRRAA